MIVQNNETHEVLMLGFTNDEAFNLSKSTGFAHFWSRSRQEIWLKGATSGNKLKIVEIKIDCDKDAILYLVEAGGPACHTGKKSCFN